MEQGGASIRYRTALELAPAGSFTPEQVAGFRAEIIESKLALAVIRKQKETGIWGANLMALGPSPKDGIKEAGTVTQYRRLLQLAWPLEGRPFRLADRILYRVLSRDEDPALLFEYQKLAKSEPAGAEWARGVIREGACAALAEAGHLEDPRLRGAAHKIASAISHFLRSPLAEKPFIRAGSHTVLHAEAYPPSWYSVAMLAAMPNLQRERAGFTERLGAYLAHPAPKKAFVVQIGKKVARPTHLLLGDPIEADAKGHPKDLPLSLHYIELMARIGALQFAPVATRVLARLLKECDDAGVWRPKNLRSQPKVINRAVQHAFPLAAEEKSLDSKQVDVTFRLALIARALGWPLEYT